MKEYDYILANILNPGFSNQDFKDILGMNMENTQILFSQFGGNFFHAILNSKNFGEI